MTGRNLAIFDLCPTGSVAVKLSRTTKSGGYMSYIILRSRSDLVAALEAAKRQERCGAGSLFAPTSGTFFVDVHLFALDALQDEGDDDCSSHGYSSVSI